MLQKFVGLLTLVAMLGVMLAACGGPPEPLPTPVPSEPTAPAAGTEPTEPTDEDAAETPTRSATTGEFEGKIKIATQTPLSGPQAALGTGIKNGAALAIEQLGTALTDMGFELELAPFDDEAQPEKGSANANNIVSDSDILCVDGHYNSGVALAALPTYNNANLLMVSPANTSPLITESGFDVAYRIVGRDDVQGAVGEQFAREELGIESVYILHDQTDYGQGIAEFFRQGANENDIEILGFEGTQEQSVFDSILTPIQDANPDLLYFGGIYSQAGPLLKQARERGIEAQFLGPDGLDSPEMSRLAGDAAEGMHYTTVAAPVSQFPKAEQFATDYQETYGEPAPPFSAQGYDAAGICIAAIAKAAEEAGGKPTRAEVLAAMETLDTYQGITGDYDFNEKGDPVKATYFVLKVNMEDWNQNEVITRLDVSPPSDDDEEDTAGSTTTPSGDFSGVIKIAMQAPLSGEQAALGAGLKNGAELSIKQNGAKLTDLGFDLQLSPFDDEAQPEKGSANANNIVADRDVLCLMGHLNSGVSLAALPTYNNANLVMISPSNTNPDITESGFDVAYRIVGRDEVQGTVGEQFARETLGIQSVYILHDQTDYGQGIASYFRQSAEENGIEVLGFEGTEERTNFESILTPIQAEQPDLIYFGGVYPQASALFSQARERGIEAEFMGPDALDSPELLRLGGDAVAGLHYTSIAGPVSEFPDAAAFATDYQDTFGEAAPPFSAQAYDATGLCIQAIADAAETVGGKPTRADVLAAMQKLQPYDGITGTFEFTDKGDPVQATYFILQVDAKNWDDNKIIDRLSLSPPGEMDKMDQKDDGAPAIDDTDTITGTNGITGTDDITGTGTLTETEIMTDTEDTETEDTETEDEAEETP